MGYRPITDMWILARCKYKSGAKRYGGYPGGFMERARALLGVTINDPVLHVCAGLVRDYPYRGGFGPNDKTLDLDPLCAPDFLQPATDPLPAGFKAILADPPYTEEDADHYPPSATRFPSPGALLRNMLDVLEPGRRCGLLHYLCPTAPDGVKFVACVGVLVGFNNRIRVYSVYEKLV